MRERSRSLRRRRVVRWTFFLIIVGALWFGIVRRYSVMTLDIATVEAMEPEMRQGARHVIDRRPGFALLRGWIVWWTHAGGALFSRVAAVPGDVMIRRDGRWAVRHPDASTSLLAPEVRLDESWDGRELQPEEYLLLNDRPDTRWPDSRRLGPIARAEVVARVLFAFGDGR